MTRYAVASVPGPFFFLLLESLCAVLLVPMAGADMTELSSERLDHPNGLGEWIKACGLADIKVLMNGAPPREDRVEMMFCVLLRYSFDSLIHRYV